MRFLIALGSVVLILLAPLPATAQQQAQGGRGVERGAPGRPTSPQQVRSCGATSTTTGAISTAAGPGRTVPDHTRSGGNNFSPRTKVLSSARPVRD